MCVNSWFSDFIRVSSGGLVLVYGKKLAVSSSLEFCSFSLLLEEKEEILFVWLRSIVVLEVCRLAFSFVYGRKLAVSSSLDSCSFSSFWEKKETLLLCVCISLEVLLKGCLVRLSDLDMWGEVDGFFFLRSL